jgi:hypothetical protein
LLLIFIWAASLFIYSGIYPVGADSKHNALTYWLLDTMREQSIDRASGSTSVPDLDAPELLLMDGTDYNDMCASCHMKPGKLHTGWSRGLYPSPPYLTLYRKDVVINVSRSETGSEASILDNYAWHQGIDHASMGDGHDDELIWAMVAFIELLPELSGQQYQILSGRKDSSQHDRH